MSKNLVDSFLSGLDLTNNQDKEKLGSFLDYYCDALDARYEAEWQEREDQHRLQNDADYVLLDNDNKKWSEKCKRWFSSEKRDGYVDVRHDGPHCECDTYCFYSCVTGKSIGKCRATPGDVRVEHLGDDCRCFGGGSWDLICHFEYGVVYGEQRSRLIDYDENRLRYHYEDGDNHDESLYVYYEPEYPIGPKTRREKARKDQQQKKPVKRLQREARAKKPSVRALKPKKQVQSVLDGDVQSIEMMNREIDELTLLCRSVGGVGVWGRGQWVGSVGGRGVEDYDDWCSYSCHYHPITSSMYRYQDRYICFFGPMKYPRNFRQERHAERLKKKIAMAVWWIAFYKKTLTSL